MLNLVRLWILSSTLLVSSGWMLSTLHLLTAVGYGAVFVPAIIAGVFWQRKTGWRPKKTIGQFCGQFLRRFKRAAPFCFLALMVLTFLAGSLYPAINFDADSYRTPRVLHWLWAGHCHWIHTADFRMNAAGCGMEWLTAPLILFTHTDRPIFLINWVSYAMLPGLIFSVFTRLQVRQRVAWWWMWVLPSGWCFALQASSTCNDSIAAVYALASVDLALRSNEQKRDTDLWLSLLACALTTGVKQTNIPLVALWVVAAWPSLRRMFQRPLATTAVIMLGGLVSIVPTSLLNLKHYGTWLPLNEGVVTNYGAFQLNPFWGIIGNALCIPVQNLMPPFFPWTSAWGEGIARFRQTPFGNHFNSFESFAAIRPGIGEINAGIGLGICLFTLVSLGAVLFFRRLSPVLPSRPATWSLFWLRVLPWFLLLLFMAKVGSFANARQLAPYYAILFPALLARPGHETLVRQPWWQFLALLVIASAALLVAVEPNHPLFPVRSLVAILDAKYPNSGGMTKFTRIYRYQWSLEDQRTRFIRSLPPDVTKVGYAAAQYGRIEPWLWLPFGRRDVTRVLPSDTPATLRKQGLQYLVIEDIFLGENNLTIDQCLTRYDGQLETTLIPEKDPGNPDRQFYFVRLHPQATGH